MDAVDLGAACSPAIQEQLKGGLPTLVLGHHSFHDLHPTVKDLSLIHIWCSWHSP